MAQQGATGATIEAVPLGDELFTRLVELIETHRASDPFGPVTVVTPSYYSSYYLRRRLGLSGYFNVNLTRLDDLASLICSQPMDGPPLKRIQAASLVHEAAMAAAPGGKFEAIRSHASLHAALRNTFRDIDAVGGLTQESPPLNGVVLQEVLDAYEKYRELRKPWIEQIDVARAAVQELRKRDYDLGELGKLIVLRIDVPPPQFAPLERMLDRVPNATILVALTGNRAVDGLIAKDGGALFPTASSDNAKTKLVSAPNRVEEVRYVVRDIVRRAKTDGTPFGRMAVLFSDRSYGERVEEALRMSRVPVSGPDQSPIGRSPEGRFVSGIVRLFEAHHDGGWSRQDFTSWITSSPVVDPHTSQGVPASRWNVICRNAEVTAGLDGFRTCLTRYQKQQRRMADWREESDEYSDTHVAALRSQAGHTGRLLKFIEELADQSPPPKAKSYAVFAKWLRRLCEGYMRPEEEGVESQDRKRIYDLLREVEAVQTTQDVAVDFRRFAGVIQGELSRPRGSGRPLGTGVFTGQLGFAVGCQFDVVYVLGMSEGAYPSSPSADPLLGDEARRRLDPSGELLPDTATKTARDHRTYLAALMTAPVRYLLWPRAGAGDRREVGPARWLIDEARKITRKPLLQGSNLLQPELNPHIVILRSTGYGEQEIDHSADPHEYRLRTAAAHRASARPREELFLLSEPSSALNRGLALEDARASHQWTKYDGNLRGASPPGLESKNASPTGLASWADCPYSYFLTRVLRVEETVRPEDRLNIDPLQSGNLVHDVLERFVKERKDGEDGGLPERKRLLRQVAEGVFNDFERDELTAHLGLWSVRRETLLRALMSWLPAAERALDGLNVKPQRAEMQFGEDGSDAPPVKVPISGGREVSFRGRIDLVAVSGDGSRVAVFDYKTGSGSSYSPTGLSSDPTERGRKLQLPIYALAAAQSAVPGSGRLEVMAAYWFVMSGGSGKWIPDPNGFDLENSKVRLEEVVTIMADGISEGLFPPAPRGSGASSGGWGGFENCRYCPYDAVCPSGRREIWDRKKHAPSLKPYVELQA